MRTVLASGALAVVVAAMPFMSGTPRQWLAVATQAASASSRSGSSPSTAAQARESTSTATTAKRKIPCKTPENASICYWTRGRLAVYNGNPSARIWKIGTRRLLGVYSGPSHFPPRSIADDESPDLPPNLERAYEIDYRRWKQSDAQYYEYPIVFADLEVCPLEPEKEGWMQAVCVESAKNLFIEKGWR